MRFLASEALRCASDISHCSHDSWKFHFQYVVPLGCLHMVSAVVTCCPSKAFVFVFIALWGYLFLFGMRITQLHTEQEPFYRIKVSSTVAYETACLL